MSSRRWGVGVAVVVTVLVVVGATAVLLFEPVEGPMVEHRFATGGFTLTLPSPWRIHVRESAHDPWEWIEADRPTRLGPSDAWLWLNRTSAARHRPLTTGRRYALAAIRDDWGDVEITTEHITFAGRPAIRLQYSHPYIDDLELLPTGDVDVAQVITERGGQLYELGVAGWRGIPAEARNLERLLRLSTPSGQRTINDTEIGVHLAIPAAWNRGQTPRPDIPDAVLTATTPSDPPTAWTILWILDEQTTTAVAHSAAKAAREGNITRRSHTRIGGVSATHIDFVRRTSDDGIAYCSTWIFTGPNGKAWQLLVGSRTEDRSAATEIARSVRFLRPTG